jgi:hypothetical protein
MRSVGDGLALVFASLMLLAGCATDEHLKPPKMEESYTLPPNESRYCNPPEIPRKYLMQDLPRKDADVTGQDAMPRSARTGGATRGY